MLDLIDSSSAAPELALAGEPLSGPTAADQGLMQALDLIDYGVVVLDASGRTLHLNRSAHQALAGNHPLCLARHLHLAPPTLTAHRLADVRKLTEGLEQARQGRRQLLQLGAPEQAANVAVIPMPGQGVPAVPRIALLLARRVVCEPLSVQCYARSHELTPAESRVLEYLSAGAGPAEIARHLDVAITTVRTQISAIRAKTGAGNLRELLHAVSVLPPMAAVLRW